MNLRDGRCWEVGKFWKFGNYAIARWEIGRFGNLGNWGLMKLGDGRFVKLSNFGNLAIVKLGDGILGSWEIRKFGNCDSGRWDIGKLGNWNNRMGIWHLHHLIHPLHPTPRNSKNWSPAACPKLPNAQSKPCVCLSSKPPTFKTVSSCPPQGHGTQAKHTHTHIPNLSVVSILPPPPKHCKPPKQFKHTKWSEPQAKPHPPTPHPKTNV